MDCPGDEITLHLARDFGAGSIARHIMRSGIQINRTSVRQILEEEQPPHQHRETQSCRTINTAPTHLMRAPKATPRTASGHHLGASAVAEAGDRRGDRRL